MPMDYLLFTCIVVTNSSMGKSIQCLFNQHKCLSIKRCPIQVRYVTTLSSKRNLSLICPFSLVPLGHWPWHKVLKFLPNSPLRVICKRSHFKIPDDSLTILKCLEKRSLRKSRNNSNLIKPYTNPAAFSNVVFLLGKGVCQGSLGWYFIFAL